MTADSEAVTSSGVDVTDAQVELARTALAEIAPAEVIGDLVSVTREEDAVSLQFECLVAGYPHWFWTASLSTVEGQEPQTVLETELMPGEGALLAPEWVPWSERMAEYRANQRKEAEEAEAADASDDAEPDEAPSAGTLGDDSDDDIDDPRDEADDLDEIFDGVDFEDEEDDENVDDSSDEN